ncbi:MAG: helix-turn-helix domain-containing protein [Prevotella pallens]|jgi:helicase family protein|uniref:helix-turn-helix domain-containing protein n=1 Tax=Prevotella pallens TaxID=60133 RepID=UPI001CB3B6AB|nr:helix-turn-helix domain-containing protein [Prevotella pallens]MBF1488365.1 helix-turn-helix domain-containing protein [Prevotella pallens]
MENNTELRNAWDFVEHTGISIFLTGKAGTGKTTFLRTIKQQSTKRMIVVAPTGVAAINANGVTIHSFFQLPLSPFVPESTVKPRFEYSKQKRQIMRTLDLLIIDEISMVRADILDAIDSILRRFREHNKPFGGVQLLMIGDLQQLTPIVRPDEEKLLSRYYNTPYFFDSKALQSTQYVTIELTKVFRQQDKIFIDILNHFRDGNVSDEDFDILNKRYQPNFTPDENSDYIHLTTHNRIADNINDRQLEQIKEQVYKFCARVEGQFPENSYPADYELTLKCGAQVMFIHNDRFERYYNGKIGRITYIDNERIEVSCPNENEKIEVEPQTWENTRYTLNETTKQIEGEVLGTFTQYPLRLAWAITIHKSQGLTFEHAIIDAQQAFASGQVYVALSRCRTLEGLVLASTLNRNAVINDARVDSYIAQQNIRAAESIKNLPLLKEEYYRMMLLELFNFSEIYNAESALFRTLVEHFHKHTKLIALHQATVSELKEKVLDISTKWTQYIKGISIVELHNKEFLDRIKSSAQYFYNELSKIFADQIEQTKGIESKNKEAIKRIDNNISEVEQSKQAKLLLLEDIMIEDFSTSHYLKCKQEAILISMGDEDIAKQRNKKHKVEAPKKKKEATHNISYKLYKAGMTLEAIAKERGLTIETVVRHIAKYVRNGELSVTNFVDDKKIAAIQNALNNIPPNEGMKYIKDVCSIDVTYSDIIFVLANNERTK